MSAVELQDAGLLVIKVDPFLDSIRGTPQFETIVRELDFPSQVAMDPPGMATDHSWRVSSSARRRSLIVA